MDLQKLRRKVIWKFDDILERNNSILTGDLSWFKQQVKTMDDNRPSDLFQQAVPQDMRENRTANSGIRAPDEHCIAIKTAITP